MIKFQTQIFNSGMLIGNIWNGLKAFVSIKKCWPFYLYWPLLIYDGFFQHTPINIDILSYRWEGSQFQNYIAIASILYGICFFLGVYFLAKNFIEKAYGQFFVYLAHLFIIVALSKEIYSYAFGFGWVYLTGKSP